MKDQVCNARITSASIFIEDHGILTSFIQMDYGGACQGFGGYAIGGKGANYAGHWVSRIFETLEVDDWKKLVGETCRCRIEGGMIKAIGHILKDKWFEPGAEFKNMEAMS